MSPFLWAFFILSTLSYGHSAVAAMNFRDACNESNHINYVELYNDAVVYLDMEDLDMFTKDMGNTHVDVHNCSDVLQTYGIPWNIHNFAMGFNSIVSYVHVRGDTDLNEAMTVSLWVKNFKNNQICTICTVEVAHHTFTLRKLLPTHANDGYELSYGGSEPLSVKLQDNWNWNLISFTVIQRTICIFVNGVNLQNTNCKPLGSDIDFTDSKKFSISLNSPEGCQGVEVDEVAMWSRALNMSELIALRVQPFNKTCEPYWRTIKKLQDASVREASDRFRELVKSRNTTVNHTKQLLTFAASKGLLTDSSLNETTKRNNREAFVNLASYAIGVADGSPEIAQYAHINQLIDEFEETLRGVFFYSNITNQTISTEYIYLAYVKFSEDHKKFDKIFPVPTTNIEFTMPKNNFKAGEQEMLVIVYKQNVNGLVILNKSAEEPILTDVLSLQLPFPKGEVASPIDLRFNVDQETVTELKGENRREPSCKYLDLENSTWLTNGVKTVYTTEYSKKTNKHSVVCTVSHLTNFAVLMSPVELEEDSTLSVLSYLLLIVSIVCLLITFVVLVCLREIGKSQRVQILKQFIFALMMAQLLFVIASEWFVGEQVLCKLAAALSHYFWLSAFTWMLVQGVQLYTKVRRLVGGNIKQLFYVLFAWGFPLPLAIIPLIINFVGNRTLNVCLLPADLIVFFAVPVIFVFCVNLMVTVLVMKTFLTVKANKDKSDAEKLKSSVRAVIVMVPVLGLTWVFGFFLLIHPTFKLVQYMFVILNCLQGVFVFLLHLVLNEDVRSALLRRRNKVANSTENTIFTKVPRNKQSESGSATDTSKVPLPSDTTNM